jgi:hypothetical protein
MAPKSPDGRTASSARVFSVADVTSDYLELTNYANYTSLGIEGQ